MYSVGTWFKPRSAVNFFAIYLPPSTVSFQPVIQPWRILSCGMRSCCGGYVAPDVSKNRTDFIFNSPTKLVHVHDCVKTFCCLKTRARRSFETSANTYPKLDRCENLKNPNLLRTLGAGIQQTVQQLATGWTVRGSNPGGDDIFRTC
jgi:hypothetical protein